MVNGSSKDIVITVNMQIANADGTPVAEKQTTESDADKKTKAAGKKSKSNPAIALASQIAKKTATTALDNYGNLTGDYTTQRNVQTAIGLASDIAASAALGPVGWIMYGANALFQAYSFVSNQKRSERDAAFKQERVGISINRS